MFGHLYINKLKVLLRNKSMLFWTLAFPFILGTFFQIALGNIDEAFELETIPIAIVNNDEFNNNENFKSIIASLSEENENQLFSTSYVTIEEAEELLSDDKIEGYIIMKDNNPELTINKSDINSTVIKYRLDQYYQITSTVNNIINYDYKAIYSGALEILKDNKSYVKDNTTENINFSINYFFTLIAMTCLYGSLIGLEVIKDCEANLSTRGSRICVAPVKKIKFILSGLLAGYTIQIVALLLLFAYLIFAFHIPFGNHILQIILLGSVGCIAGTSLGTFVGVSNKKPEGFKIGLLIAIIMVCCFTSGMMGDPSLRLFFNEKLPLFRMINPVNIITDGLYSLFAYDTLTVFYGCLLRISIFTIIMILLTTLFVRRKSYDSL